VRNVVRAALATAGTGAAALAYAGLVERRWFALRHATLPLLRPPARRPLRVLHLSDLHLPSGRGPIHAFVERCLAQHPDVVVLTGDILGHADAIEPAVELLSGLRGATGIAVLGSNDRFGPSRKNPLRYFSGPTGRVEGPRLDTDRLVEGLERAGWQLFDNRRASVQTPAGVLDVAGLGDPHIRLDAPEQIDWTPPTAGVAARLGVVHAPYQRALDVFDLHGFDLALAGHTHGGQVRVPGVGALVANCDLPLRQARGVSRYGVGLWLHVSAGAGQSIYAPIRFACRPEATLLDLVAQ
jgi:uncharacterized protein